MILAVADRADGGDDPLNLRWLPVSLRWANPATQASCSQITYSRPAAQGARRWRATCQTQAHPAIGVDDERGMDESLPGTNIARGIRMRR